MKTHPKGSNARVLLTSVFGPYARDDEFGSRAINPMELYHNQVTRAQGPFSPRIFHRSWGITMIQANISAPCTVLDFPTREAFERELRDNRYDIVGISSIIVNAGKAREMCRTVRRLSPQSVIVVGGHVAAIPMVEQMLDADHIVKGEGIGWMRSFLGEDSEAPIVHPPIVSGFGHRVMGMKLPKGVGSTAATVIPSVGCPMGCNFCTTSSFFGGKGKFFNFYETGAELYRIMAETAERLKVRCFFLMDENFLLYRRRAIQLLDAMRNGGKNWELYVFSSANALAKYSMEELVALGISWVWMGLESPRSGYAKLNGSDTLALTRNLQSNGIKVLGSTIVGMEHHTLETVREEVEYAIGHETDFHQFMLYTPVPGTPLHADMQARGKLIDTDLADIHGQYKFNFVHDFISRDESKTILDWAFQRDFDRNGPSLYRMCRTTLEGWRRHRYHPEARVRERFEKEVVSLKHIYSAMLWAIECRLKETNASISSHVHALRKEIAREFGFTSTLATGLAGPWMLWSTKREEKRMAAGLTYEPATVIERRNWARSTAL